MVLQNLQDTTIIAFLSCLVVCISKAAQNYEQINLGLTLNFTDKDIKSLQQMFN